MSAPKIARRALFAESVGDTFARDVEISLLADEIRTDGGLLRMPWGDPVRWSARFDAMCAWAVM